jgi:hypothetical protein
MTVAMRHRKFVANPIAFTPQLRPIRYSAFISLYPTI